MAGRVLIMQLLARYPSRFQTLTLTLIFILALVLRFYNLSTHPPGLYVDEASILYNAYSISETLRDEHGQYLPFWFEAYGEYKLPGYIYPVAFLVKLFGLHDLVVRLPSALAGSLSTLLIFFLSRELILRLPLPKRRFASFPLLSSFFWAISPWSIHFSRAGFEANLSLFYILFGIVLTLYGLRTHRSTFLPSGIFFFLSAFTYNSARMFVPLFLLVMALAFRREIFPLRRQISQSLLLLTIICLPFIPAQLDSKGLHRALTLTYLHQGSLTDNLQEFIHQYFYHFDTNYLFFQGDQNGRHSVRELGMLYYFDLPLIILGAHTLIRRFPRRLLVLILAWILLAPIPSALTLPNPHALRSLHILPAYILLSALGLSSLITHIFTRLSLQPLLKHLLLTFIGICLFANFVIYLNEYTIRYPQTTAMDWANGYKETVLFIQSRYSLYDRFYLSYDLPPNYLAMYLPIAPQTYQTIPNKYNRHTPPINKVHFFEQTSDIVNPPGVKALIIAPTWQAPLDLQNYQSILLINSDPLFHIWEYHETSR